MKYRGKKLRSMNAAPVFCEISEAVSVECPKRGDWKEKIFA